MGTPVVLLPRAAQALENKDAVVVMKARAIVADMDRLQSVQLVQVEGDVDVGGFGVERVPDQLGDGRHRLGLGNGFQVVFANLNGDRLQTNKSSVARAPAHRGAAPRFSCLLLAPRKHAAIRRRPEPGIIAFAGTWGQFQVMAWMGCRAGFRYLGHHDSRKRSGQRRSMRDPDRPARSARRRTSGMVKAARSDVTPSTWTTGDRVRVRVAR